YGQQPDFGVILPNAAGGRYSSYDPQFTTDIVFANPVSPTVPLTPTIGTPIGIWATVRNFSLTPFNATSGPLQVAFYQGDPAQGATLIGTQTVGPLVPQGRVDVMQTFTPQTAGCLPIWVVLDPNNQLQEV